MAAKSTLTGRARGLRTPADPPEPEPDPGTLAFGQRAAKRVRKLKKKKGANLSILGTAKLARERRNKTTEVLEDEEYN